MSATIHILLASYQGEAYLQTQLDSIIAQQHRDWRLLVRDDGSTDRSVALLQRAAARDARIRLIEDGRGRLGASGNFFALMQHALDDGAHTFALCDQDDRWRPDKLAQLQAGLRSQAAALGETRPLLLFSDLAWVDAHGRRIADSGFDACGGRAALSASGQEARWLLAMNLIPGCAMLGNRALLELALPQPAAVVHHDWWLAALAAAFGTLVPVDRVLGDYRLHDRNTIGAATVSARILQAIRQPCNLLRRGRRTYWEAVALARALGVRAATLPANPGWNEAIRFAIDALGAPRRITRMHATLNGPVARVGPARRLLALLAAALPAPKEPS